MKQCTKCGEHIPNHVDDGLCSDCKPCPFCGGSRFIHSGIQIPVSARECWDKRAVVLMLRPHEIGKRP